MAEKRRAFEEWLQRRDSVTYDRYRAQRVVVKWAVQVAKRNADAWCLYSAPVHMEGDKCESINLRGISLFSGVGKLFGRVLIKRVRAGTESAIGEKQCGFRQGRGCMAQVFAIRQVFEKYLANGEDVFWAFMDLEKAYDTIDRHGMWQMLRVYGVTDAWSVWSVWKIIESSADF